MVGVTRCAPIGVLTPPPRLTPPIMTVTGVPFGPTGTVHLPYVADLYERGLSLNVMSKSFGLPGLRIGWIACKDSGVISRMERLKHYLSICNSGPSERLAKIALRNRGKLLARNCAIVDENLPKWNAFFARHQDLFDWYRPQGSCTAFPSI